MSRRERLKDFMTDAGIGVASRAGGYLRAGPGGVNVEKILLYAGLAFGVYMLFKTWKLGQAIAAPLNAVGSSIGGKLADWFVPTAGEVTTYAVQFPGGARHAIDSRSVSADGTFFYNNVRYRMAVDKSIVSGINKFAVKL